MKRDFLAELHGYFSKIENPDAQEKHLLQRLESELSYFKITSETRDDLETAGFDATDVSDSIMESLARKLADDYCGQLFWSSLSLLAEDYFHIPKNMTICCPLCSSNSIEKEIGSERFCCTDCNSKWSDVFVLVEFPEYGNYFDHEKNCYPAFNSDDNAACYIPEYDYLNYFREYPSKEKYFKPVTWPESQKYMDNPSCEAILTNEKGMDEFGESSFWVPLMLIQNSNDL